MEGIGMPASVGKHSVGCLMQRSVAGAGGEGGEKCDSVMTERRTGKVKGKESCRSNDARVSNSEEMREKEPDRRL